MPRTRGLYVIDKEGQIADEMAKEDKSFPYTSDTLRVISVEKIDEVIQPAPLNNDDLLAIKKYFINVKVVDLSAAVFDTIPDNCFKIEALKTVILPEEGIKVIGSEAFYPLVSSSFALTHIGPPSAIVTTDNDGKPVLTKPKTYIPAGVEIIGSKAFYYALGEAIRIPSSVASIGTHASYFHKATSIVFANPENEKFDNTLSYE